MDMIPTIDIPADGRRMLVDRLWPRDLTKVAVRLDDWLTDVAPGTEPRRWHLCSMRRMSVR
jgi:uncharacterized protein YeaO (DUF488 family)